MDNDNAGLLPVDSGTYGSEVFSLAQIVNFEGVNGLEQMKWSPASLDQVKYDVMIPFIRQVSGPMDYTQGGLPEWSFPCAAT